MLRRIEILTFPNVLLLDVAGPLQVFDTAAELVAESRAARPYELSVVADAPRVRTTTGLVLETGPLPSVASDLDTLIVAGGRGVNAACEDQSLVRWVRERAARARRASSLRGRSRSSRSRCSPSGSTWR